MPLHRESSTRITFRFTSPLPVTVRMGGKRWIVGLSYYPKGKAEIQAMCGGEIVGAFVGGDSRRVERALGAGISIPIGTVRHRLALAMVEAGYGTIADWRDEARDEIPG